MWGHVRGNCEKKCTFASCEIQLASLEMKKLFILLFVLLGSIQTTWAASYIVYIRTLWGGTILLDLANFDTVLSVKEKILDKDKENHPDFYGTDGIAQFYLTFAGRVIDDNATLYDYNIQKEDELYMVSSDVTPTIMLTANEAETGEYWTTFYNELSFNLEVPEGTKVFTVNLEGTTLTVTEVEDRIIKSHQAVVMKNTVDRNITMTYTAKEANDSYYANNSLKGQSYYYWGLHDAYVLNYKPSIGVGFYKLVDGTIISGGKAYLTYTVPQGAPAREYFAFGNGTSDIEPTTQMAVEEQDTYYDLQGRHVEHPSKGLYIIHPANSRGYGKKVIVR